MKRGQMGAWFIGRRGRGRRCTVSPFMTAVCTEYKFQAAIARQRAGIPNQAQAQTKPKPKPEFWAVSVLGAGTGIHGMGILQERVGSVTGQEAQGWVTLAPRCMHWPPPRNDIDSTIRRFDGSTGPCLTESTCGARMPGPLLLAQSVPMSPCVRGTVVLLAPWQ